MLAGRAGLDERFAELSRRYPAGTEVPVPPHWGGFRVSPVTVEFWQGRASRLHDRLRYRRATSGPAGSAPGPHGAPDWVVERLAP